MRNKLALALLGKVSLAALMIVGCRSPQPYCFQNSGKPDPYRAVATRIERPEVQACSYQRHTDSLPPHRLDSEPPTEFWKLGLPEVITIALQNNNVLKELGGRTLTTPEAVPTVYDPALSESNPRFGPEAALSAFDAQLNTNLFWTKNDRALNNPVSGGSLAGQREFQQDFGSLETEIGKTAATGTRFAIRSITDFDRNNANQAGRLFPESWNTQFEFSVRQPLLQGAGVNFNRIAGPNAQPGFNFTTGVVLARINTDISLTDFETGVINFVSDIEQAYWDLYFAYRELDAAVLARDEALVTWQSVKARFDKNLLGGEAYNEARARSQYYLFQDQVQDALCGTSTGGLSVGVYAGERRLRWLMGLPTNEVLIIRPSSEPPLAEVRFDWYESLSEAFVRRVELRRQKWEIKRRELELIAARNFVLPRLDGVATHRVRGFGEKLAGNSDVRFGSAFSDLGTWNYQEWEAGIQLNMPLGFRQGRSALRHAQLSLARARAIIQEQEAEVSLGLSDAFAAVSRSYGAVRVGFDRLAAAQQERDATQAAYDADQVTLNQLLESQRRLADAQRRYYRSLTDYAISLRDVNAEKGSLLQYNNIQLSEGLWPRKAYQDAAEVARRIRPQRFDFSTTLKPAAVSVGPMPQQIEMGASGDRLEQLPPTAPNGESEAIGLPRPKDASAGSAAAPPNSLPPIHEDLPPVLPPGWDGSLPLEETPE